MLNFFSVIRENMGGVFLSEEWDKYYQHYTENGLKSTLEKIATEKGIPALKEFEKFLQGMSFDDLPDDTELGQSKYDFRSMVFPEDIGTKGSYNGHYMVINVNVSDFTNFGKTTRNGRTTTNFTLLDNELSKVDALRANIDRTYLDDKGRSLHNPMWIQRRTRRIAESIALYMPNTMVFSHRNAYDEIGLTDIAFKSIVTASSLAERGNKAYHAVKSSLEIGTSLTKLAGQPLNPRVEVMFSNTMQREFQFDFLLAPSTPTESIALEQIIKTLRFHAAPEHNPFAPTLEGMKALLWTPPSEFDITFYHRGKENESIPKINTCVLQGIDVDYAPTGVYSTFSNGKPVQARLMLNFREVEVPHKLRILQGF